MKANQRAKAFLCYGALFVISAVAAFPCFRFLPARIEYLRFYHREQPLVLPSDLLLAKHMSEICLYAPVLFMVLGLVSLFCPAVTQTRVIAFCAFGLAALYSVFILLLSLSFDTAIMTLKVR